MHKVKQLVEQPLSKSLLTAWDKCTSPLLLDCNAILFSIRALPVCIQVGELSCDLIRQQLAQLRGFVYTTDGSFLLNRMDVSCSLERVQVGALSAR